MQKRTKILYLIGSLLMFIPVLIRQLPEDMGDFIKGFGVSLILGAFIIGVINKKPMRIHK